MPPLNHTYLTDEPFVNSDEHYIGRSSPTAVCRDLRGSFERELNNEDPAWKFALPPPRRGKAVSFDTQIQVRYIANREDWSQQERFTRWNSADDYTNFQLDIFNTLYLMRNDPGSIDDACHSQRGVECRDPDATKYRRQIRKEAWEVVFERQKIQRQMNDEPSGYNYLVASMYCHATKSAMRLALDFAAQDEIDSKEIQNEGNFSGKDDFDFFDHSWVGVGTSASSRRDSSSFFSPTEKDVDEGDFGFCVLGETSGFDNSWLRGDV